MSTRQRRLPLEEHARRGREIYERFVRPQVEKGNKGKIVAIDIDTEEFELADEPMAATDRLLARLPDAQIWQVRIGFPGVDRFGHRKVKIRKCLILNPDLSLNPLHNLNRNLNHNLLRNARRT